MPAAAKARSVAPLKDLYEIGEIPPLGHVPEKMHAWAIRKERQGPPDKSMQLEVVPTWPIGEDEVLVHVMAGGVNYNGIWAGLGQPISVLDVHKHPYHIAGSDAAGVVWAVGAKVQALEGRRRGHRPLQSGRRRRRGLQWRRPDAVAVATHLGLRDAGRLVRAVLPRAVAPVHGQADASDLGRIGLLHADAGDRLSHAVRPSAAYAQARRQRAGLGRLRRARRVRRAAGGRLRAPTPSASSPTNPSANTCSVSAPRA